MAPPSSRRRGRRNGSDAPSPSGVRLADLSEGGRLLRVVHMETEEWVITSDLPTEAVLVSGVADVLLPGRLGAYAYPSDAVFHLRDAGGSPKETTRTDLAACRVAEEQAVPSIAERIGLVHHVTVPSLAEEDDVCVIYEEEDGGEEEEESGADDSDEEEEDVPCKDEDVANDDLRADDPPADEEWDAET